MSKNSEEQTNQNTQPQRPTSLIRTASSLGEIAGQQTENESVIKHITNVNDSILPVTTPALKEQIEGSTASEKQLDVADASIVTLKVEAAAATIEPTVLDAVEELGKPINLDIDTV
ncbi:hypothetical protein [Rickettsia endosymbiont of Halotydeus destructor]|uniref:hypothetical protein n=1 Tax=Rickettsia endosymbiont of Halotydeus destructor TaxID=2996754 RepID=UPI003BAF2231